MMRAAVLTCVLVMATPAYAQRLEVSGGIGWLGASTLGDGDATLRTPASGSLPLFSVDSELSGAMTVNASAGFLLNRRWTLEGGLVMSRPEVRTSISADAEGAAPVTVVERIDQYVVEGRVLLLFNEVRLGAAATPFVSAGAAYVRQLHEGQTVIEEGHAYHVGGGLKYPLLSGSRAAIAAVGLRLDARLYLFASGLSFDDGPRAHGALSGAVYVSF